MGATWFQTRPRRKLGFWRSETAARQEHGGDLVSDASASKAWLLALRRALRTWGRLGFRRVRVESLAFGVETPETAARHLEHGGDLVSTRVSKFAVHAERVVTLVKQSL